MPSVAAVALLDTNVLIRHLTDEQPIPFALHQYAVSVLTVFELLQYPGVAAAEERAIRDLLSLCIQLPVDAVIAERAASFARTHRIGPIDLLLAATALEYELSLLTHNIKDFRRLPGLRVRTSF